MIRTLKSVWVLVALDLYLASYLVLPVSCMLQGMCSAFTIVK